MMNQKQSNLFLLILIGFGFLLRILWIDIVPPGLNSDELLIAYDGASVYRTGQDHHGEWFPVFFKQSGEYRQPVHVYLTGLFTSLFGINAYTVRMVSVLSGTLSILMTYLLVSVISNQFTALTAAALVMISPWNIFFSRFGWEPILQTPIQLAALWMFFRWINSSQIKHLLLSAFFFALTFYTYPVERLFIPLLLIMLAAVHFKPLAMRWNQTLMSLAVFFILLIPSFVMYSIHYEAMQARWMFLSVFTRPDGVLLFFQHWLLHLSPLFQFITGSSFGMMGGMAYLVLLPFFMIGFISLLYQRQPAHLVLLWWWLVFAVPASMTFDRYDPNSIPSSMRASCGMPILEIISAIGIACCYQWLRTVAAKKMYAACIVSAVAINAAAVLHDYYFRYPAYAIQASHFGFQELVEYIEENQDSYDKIIISHKIGLHPISIAVFSKRPPSPFSHQDYPKYVLPFYHYVPTYHDWGTSEYDRYGLISRWYYQGEGKLLIAAKAGEIDNVDPIHTIAYPDGSPAFQIYEVNR